MDFKLDNGAKVTVATIRQSEEVAGCQRAAKRLFSPDRRPSDVTGEFSASLFYKDQSCTQLVYVVTKLQQNHLALLANQALKLLSQTDAARRSVLDRYPIFITGLDIFLVPMRSDGNLMLSHSLYIFTQRNVPNPTEEQEQLSRMDSLHTPPAAPRKPVA